MTKETLLIQKMGGQHAGPICRLCRAAWDKLDDEFKVHKSCIECLFDEDLDPGNFTA